MGTTKIPIELKKITRIRPDVLLSSPLGILRKTTRLEVENQLYFGANYTHKQSGFSSSFWYKDAYVDKYYWEGCNADLDGIKEGHISLAQRLHPSIIDQLNLQNFTHSNDTASTNLEPTIAILDTGFDLEHPDLKHLKGTAKTYDCGLETPQGDDDVWDTDGHGTACLGILSAIPRGTKNTSGLFPNANYQLYKITNKRNLKPLSHIEKALDIAINHQDKPDFISLSWNIPLNEEEKINKAKQELAPLFQAAKAKNIIVFCAANHFTDELFLNSLGYPASSTDVFSIGAFNWETYKKEYLGTPFATNLKLVFPITNGFTFCWPPTYNGNSPYKTQLELESSFATPLTIGLFAKYCQMSMGNTPQEHLDNFKELLFNINQYETVQCSYHITPYNIEAPMVPIS